MAFWLPVLSRNSQTWYKPVESLRVDGVGRFQCRPAVAKDWGLRIRAAVILLLRDVLPCTQEKWLSVGVQGLEFVVEQHQKAFRASGDARRLTLLDTVRDHESANTPKSYTEKVSPVGTG